MSDPTTGLIDAVDIFEALASPITGGSFRAIKHFRKNAKLVVTTAQFLNVDQCAAYSDTTSKKVRKNHDLGYIPSVYFPLPRLYPGTTSAFRLNAEVCVRNHVITISIAMLTLIRMYLHLLPTLSSSRQTLFPHFVLSSELLRSVPHFLGNLLVVSTLQFSGQRFDPIPYKQHHV